MVRLVGLFGTLLGPEGTSIELGSSAPITSGEANRFGLRVRVQVFRGWVWVGCLLRCA